MLPGWWSATATGAVIVALLGWAARLMLHATTADDVAGELLYRRGAGEDRERQCGTPQRNRSTATSADAQRHPMTL